MKKGLKIFLGAILALAIILVYYTTYSDFIKPPSEKWSKEVKISSGEVNSSVKALKFNGNYIIAHDDGTAIKVIETDMTGKILKENKIETGRFISYIALFTDGDNMFISYVEPNYESGTLYTITLNKDLKELKCEETKDVLRVQQIDDEMLLQLHSKKMEIINPKTGAKIVENVSTKLVSGSKGSDGSYIICYRVEEKFLGIKIKNHEIVERYDLGGLIVSGGMTITSICSGSDEKYIYVLIEEVYKGEYGNIQILSYDKKNKNCKIEQLAISNRKYLHNARAIESNDNSAEFLINTNDNYLDVKFRNNEIVEEHKVTRVRHNALNISVNDNEIVFVDGGKLKNVYLASNDEKFKQVNNGNRKEEAKEAFSILIGLIMSEIVNAPFYALYPLFIASIPMVLTTCLFYDSRHKKKRRVVLLFSYIMLILLKLWKVYENCFQRYPGSLPELIKNPVIIMLIMIIISSICMYLAYKKFEKDENGIDIWTFLKYALMDIFISTMFYVPYIL